MSTDTLKEKDTPVLEQMLLQVEDGYYAPYGYKSGISEEELVTELRTRKNARKFANKEERLAFLKTKHTRNLLKMRSCYYNGYGIREIAGNILYNIPAQEFYDELNTREHVPNKKEAKELRRAAAKRGR